MVNDQVRMDIAQLVAEHHQAVYGYAYRLSGSVPDAEDLTQQVFMTAHQKMGQVRSAESIRSWLFTILRNCFLKTCQKRRPVPAENLRLNMDTIPAKLPDELPIDQERLQTALGRLPEKFRLVVTMFFYEGCCYREIAEKLDLPMGTVMSRLARAKGQLRSTLFELENRPVPDRQESTAGRSG